MKTVLFVLQVLGIITAIPIIAAIFLKKGYSIVREIIINRPKQEVFDYIKYLKNQNEWGTWAKKDPNMKKSYSGIDGTVGFVYSWESDDKKVGKGSQEIKKITEGEHIEWEFLFAGKPPTQCYWITETVSENVTRMKWGFTGRMNYPLNIMILFFEKLIGKEMLEIELTNLKTTMENKELK